MITYFKYLSFNYFLLEFDKLSVHFQNFSGDMNFWNLLNIVFTSQQCAGNNMITFFEIKKLHFKWTIKWTSVLFIRNYKKNYAIFFCSAIWTLLCLIDVNNFDNRLHRIEKKEARLSSSLFNRTCNFVNRFQPLHWQGIKPDAYPS